MVVYNLIECKACGTKMMTQIQLGETGRQQYAFPCPRCAINVSFILNVNRERGTTTLRNRVGCRLIQDWKDAGLDDDEIDTVLLGKPGRFATISLSTYYPVSVQSEHFSPYLSAISNLPYGSTYGDDDNRRVEFLEYFQSAERCLVHFRQENWDLFDKEFGRRSEAPSARSRLMELYQFLTEGFAWFTLNSPEQYDRVFEAVMNAKKASPDLYDELARHFATSGKIESLWQQVASVRRQFVNVRPALQPLEIVRYWKQEYQDLSKVFIANKQFDDLRRLYIDCFETLCQLLVIAIGVESIVRDGELEIQTRKGKMQLDVFDAQPNSSKLNHIKRSSIADLFLPAANSQLRNGIGHHSAHHDPASDVVVVYDRKNTGPKITMSYTEFCHSVIALFSAFELAAIYFQTLHVRVVGRFK